jgi:hypothetical protein
MSNDGVADGNSGAAPSSSPATSTPGSTPSPAPSTPSSSEGQSYNFMSEVFGDSGTPEPAKAEPQPAPQPAPQEQPQPAPAPAPPAQAAPQEAPAQVPASSPPGAQPTTAVEPQKFDPADPISLARGLDENREAAIEHLATTVFKLEPKELEELEVDVAGTVPKLLAKAVVFAQTQFLTQLSRVVPLMIQRHGQVTERHQQNLGEFYAAWPSLDKVKHGQAVNEIAVRYRQMFPNATKEQMIEHIGPMILATVGLPITAMHRGAVAPGKPNGGQPRPGTPRAVGFVPAAPGTVAQTTTVPEDPWSFMGPEQG